MNLLSLALSLITTLLVLSTASAKVYPLEQYPYPIKNTYFATIAAALAHNKTEFLTQRELMLKPSRQNLPLIGDRASYVYFTAYQNKKAPLAFVMPGTGGSSHSDLAQFYAAILYKSGYHVVVIHNPFSWNFSISASTNGLVGYLGQDVDDLYKVMIRLKKQVDRDGAKVSSISFLSYSLGGATGVFLAEKDSREKLLNLNKIVLINPPVEFKKAIDTIEGFEGVGDKWTKSQKSNLKNHVTSVALDYLEHPEKYTLESLEKKAALTTKQWKWLIGDSFRQTLAEVLFATQIVNDMGVLKAPFSKWKPTPRMKEARTYSFYDYATQFIAKKFNLEPDPEKIFDNNDIRQFTDYIKTNPNIFIMHNQDDFLYSPESERWILDTFGENRSYIYPRGGHMGNAWFPVNIQDLVTIMKQ